jgi:DNA primase catalytic core
MVASPISSTFQRQQGQQETLSRCLEDAINSLSAEQIYNHASHNFKRSGDRLRGGCPLHQSSSGSSFVVTISSKLFWCEGCQSGGGPADYRASLKAGRWVKVRGKDFVETVRELAADANIRFPEQESSPESIAKAQKWERRRAVLAETQNYCQEVLWSDRVEALEARHYLVTERGLTEEEIKRLPIGYYPSAGELKRHLISKGFSKDDWQGTGCVWKDMERYITFLWNDASGRPLTIYGRYFKQFPPEGKPKTLATPGTKTKQSPLYFDQALKAGHKEIILVEGVLDAVLLQAKGDSRVCAYVAASCSGDQIASLQRRGITKITLCGDPDHGGERGTSSNLLRLTEAGISVYIVPKLPDGLDPDEFLIREGMEGWKAHIDAANHGFRWKAQRLTEAGNVSTDKGKAEILQSAITFCKAVKDHPDLDVFFWPVIRNSLGMEPAEFRAQLEKLWESSPVEVAELGGGNGGNGGGGDGDGGNHTGKVVRFPSYETLTTEQVTGKIDELIAQGASGSYLTGQLNRLAAASQIYIQELRKLYFERLAECDLESDRGDNKTQVENLLNLGDQSLELRDYLPQDLADPLTVWCNWLSIRPEAALTALLTGASSLHKVGTELVIHRNQAFRVPPTIFSGLVSESGQKKSPILYNIIRHPLNELRQEKIDAYNAAMEDYKAQMQVWEQSEDKGRKPEPPKEPTLYYFTNATGEAIPVQASKAPEKALLALIDELSGLFNSANSYRGGRGSDKQDTLSYHDGSGQTVLRAGGIKVDVRKIYLSIFGTIQPEVLKNHITDCSDPDGQWARFLFVNQPLAAATLSDDDGQFVQISDRITEFYRRIDQLPEMEYHLSRPAFKRYQQIYHQLEKLRVTHPKAGMRAVYSKMEGYIGRLALNLHVLWEVASGKVCPEEEIPQSIMEMAIALAKFYIGQVKLVHSFSDEEGLAPGIAKLFELSKRLDTNGKDGWVKAQQYRELFAAKKRPSAQQARSLMLEAQSMGVGRTRGTGNRLEYHWLCDNNNGDDNPPSPENNLGNLGKLREDLGKDVPYVETIANKEIEANLGNLGKGIPKSHPNGEVVNQDGNESSLEGGYLPEPSLSTPQEVCDIDPVVSSELGNNLGNPFPNPSLSSLNASTPMPLEQMDYTSGDELEEVITPISVEQILPPAGDELEQAIAPAPAQPLIDIDNMVPVADATPGASPLPQKPRVDVTQGTVGEESISAPAPCENVLEATEASPEAETPQTIATKPEFDPLDPDYSSFPHSCPWAVESVRADKAESIKIRILDLRTYEDCVALRNDRDFTSDELNWVRRNLLSQEEKERLYAVMSDGQWRPRSDS